MTTLFICWVLFPAVLGLMTVGCGLLLERATGERVPGALVLPLGFAVVVVVTQFAALTEPTAGLGIPFVVSLAALGLAVAYPWRHVRIDWWAAGAAGAVFAVFAAPVVLSGEATFAGYIKLDDTATFLGLTDWALEHGRDVAGLAPSSYEATVSLNLPFYPLGSLLPLGTGAALVGQDTAWVFQPYLAFLAALLGLVAYQLAGLVVESRPLRAGAAFLAPQAALLYGFALWGGVKELAAAPLIALVAALAGPAMRPAGGARRLLPLAVAGAAVLGVLSAGAIAWIAVPAVAVLVALARAREIRTLVLSTIALVLFAVPSLAVGSYLLSSNTNEPLRSGAELGNLARPLSVLQIAGVWPVGDFRFRPAEMDLTYVLIGLVLVTAALGIAAVVSTRAWGVGLYAAAGIAAGAGFELFGSPWVAAKALALGAPVVVLLAALGTAHLIERRQWAVGGLLGLVVASGVLWSNVLAYREVSLAPRAQLAELEEIGERFAGRGPALMTEYQPHAVRHFLRELDPEGASELRRRLVPLRDGSLLQKGSTADLDAFQLDGLLVYRTIVLRRSPLASRPPSPYRLTWRARFYEVWERSDGPEIAQHLPLGSTNAPIGLPSCRLVRELARNGDRALLAATPRAAVKVLPLSHAIRPANWTASSTDENVVFPHENGLLIAGFGVSRAGTYEVWVGGAFRGRLEASIDGRRVGVARHHLSYAGQFVSLGQATLVAGQHSVRLTHRTTGPGSSGAPWALGPLVLSRAIDADPVEVPDGKTQGLCRRSLDWIELRS